MFNSYNPTAGLIAFLWGLFFAILFIFDPLKYIAVELLQNGYPPAQIVFATLTHVSPKEWLLLAGICALGLWLFYSELRFRSVSSAVSHQGGSAFWLTFVSALALLSVSYLIPGDVVGGDASSHISRIAHTAYGIASGKIPSWDNFYYAGSTFLQFTGPLYFWVGGLLNVVIQDPTITTKVLLFSGSVLTGVFFFLCMKEHGISRYGAVIGGTVYAGAFAHLHELLIDGNHPQVFTLMIAPLSVLFLHRFLSEDGAKTWSLLTLFNIALLVNHQSMGKQFGVLMIVYTIVYLITHRERLTRLWGLSASALASVIGASFVIVPILLERQWVMMYNAPRLLEFDIPTLEYFKTLFSWNLSVREGGKYLGMVAFAFCLAAIVRLLRNRQLSRHTLLTLTVLLCLALSFFLRGSHVKHIVITLFFFAFLSSIGADVLRERLSGTTALVVLTALLFLDLGSTSFMPVNRTDKQYLHEAGLYLERELPNVRILNTQTWRNPDKVFASIGPGASIPSYYKVPYATGAHNLAATRIHNYLAVAIKDAERELNSLGKLSNNTFEELCLFNISLLFNDTGKGMGFPGRIETNVSDSVLGRAIRLENCIPIIFAEQLEVIEDWSPFDKPVLWNEQFEQPNEQIKNIRDFLSKTLENMQYSPEQGTADVLYARDGQNALDVRGKKKNVKGGLPTVRKYEVNMTEARIVVEAPSDGFIQIPESWYPTLRATRNQEPVNTYAGFQYSTIVPVVKGSNDIDLIYLQSKQRTIWLLVSVGILAFIAVIYFRAFRVGSRG